MPSSARKKNGRISGQRYFVTRKPPGRAVGFETPMLHDWYREGCEFLVGFQDKLGGGCIGTGQIGEKRHVLKQFLENGGFLFAEACDGNGCGGTAFDRSFRSLMRELFPDSELRKLPPDHAAWYAQFFF